MSLKIVRYPDVETVTLIINNRGLPEFVWNEFTKVVRILTRSLGAVFDGEEPLYVHFASESSLRTFIQMLDEYLLNTYRTFLRRRENGYEFLVENLNIKKTGRR